MGMYGNQSTELEGFPPRGSSPVQDPENLSGCCSRLGIRGKRTRKPEILLLIYNLPYGRLKEVRNGKASQFKSARVTSAACGYCVEQKSAGNRQGKKERSRGRRARRNRKAGSTSRTKPLGVFPT